MTKFCNIQTCACLVYCSRRLCLYLPRLYTSLFNKCGITPCSSCPHISLKLRTFANIIPLNSRNSRFSEEGHSVSVPRSAPLTRFAPIASARSERLALDETETKLGLYYKLEFISETSLRYV